MYVGKWPVAVTLLFGAGGKVPKAVDSYFLGNNRWALNTAMKHLSCQFAKTIPIFMQMQSLGASSPIPTLRGVVTSRFFLK